MYSDNTMEITLVLTFFRSQSHKSSVNCSWKSETRYLNCGSAGVLGTAFDLCSDLTQVLQLTFPIDLKPNQQPGGSGGAGRPDRDVLLCLVLVHGLL